MPRIPVYTVDTAPEDSRDPLKALEAKFGKLLNIHGEMAHSPVVLQSYTDLQNVITNYKTFGPAPAKPRLASASGGPGRRALARPETVMVISSPASTRRTSSEAS
jgi:hypothetical protein